MTASENEARLARERERKRAAVANMTASENEARLARKRERQREYRARASASARLDANANVNE